MNKQEYEYAATVYCAVFATEDLTDINPTAILNAVNGLLEREKYVLHKRIVTRKTLLELGKEMQISRERIRQLEVSAMRKVESRYSTGQITLEKMTAAANEYYSKLSELREESKNLKLQQGIMRRQIMKVLDGDYIKEMSFDPSTETLNLSVRAYNCLARGGITTVKTLLLTDAEILRGLKNLGECTFKEILRKMRENGHPDWADEIARQYAKSDEISARRKKALFREVRS